jgi:DnaJ-class molecular chaperone
MSEQLAPTEIRALARLLGELDYYQLLHLRRDAGTAEVKRAYHSTTRVFHPDYNRRLEPDLQEAVRLIAMRVAEAYSVLRDPRRRKAYDVRLTEAGGRVRIQLSEASAEAGRRDASERDGHTPEGRRFYKLAQRDLAKRDFAAAARNLQTALTFEPNNASFREQLAAARAQIPSDSHRIR